MTLMPEQQREQILKELQAELDHRNASLDRGEGIGGEVFSPVCVKNCA
jgi:hypothetical protein